MNKLKYSEVNSIIKEINTDGHSPLQILDSDFEVYFIKSGKGNVPALDIINEFLCHYLLNCWSIPNPDIAAIYLNSDLLEDNAFSPFYHKKNYYDQITFGSKQVQNTFELGSFIQINGKVDFRKYINPDVLVKISLFDIWAENTDRKPTNFNILIQDIDAKLKVYAMDHAFTFNHMHYKDLNPDPRFITNTYNDNILYSSLVKEVIKYLQKKGWFNELKEYFYFCIAKCEHNFDNYVKQIPNELGLDEKLVSYLKLFLFNKDRNKAVFQEFLTRL